MRWVLIAALILLGIWLIARRSPRGGSRSSADQSPDAEERPPDRPGLSPIQEAQGAPPEIAPTGRKLGRAPEPRRDATPGQNEEPPR